MKSSKVVIKKYENRRLYDTSSSRYINLEDVAALVRDGSDVQVVDAKTGEDLTRVVLAQIIMDDAREQPAGLPLELLRQLIIASDHARQEFIMWYLKSAFDTYQKVQETIQDRFHDVGAAALSPLQTVRNLLGPKAPQPDAEVQELRQRVAELEARLEKRTQRPKARSRKPAS